MIKKINILLVLLLLLLSIGAVSASEDLTTDLASNNETISEIATSQMDDSLSMNVDVADEEVSASTSHIVTESNLGDYFTRNKFNPDSIDVGDVLIFDGSFRSKELSFYDPVNIEGSSSLDMKNCVFTFYSGASGSHVSGLRITNTEDYLYGIFLNNVTNCVVDNCFINNTGISSYCIAIANKAMYNNVTNNTFNEYGITYGHGSRSTTPMLLSDAHYNYLANNHITCDDANAIYLSTYGGGPIIPDESNYNIIYNNTIRHNVLPTSWCYSIQAMGRNNTIDSNKVIGAYRGISTSGKGNIIINNQVINLTGADYNNPTVENGGDIGIVASANCIVRNNSIINAKVISTGAGITALDNTIVEDNYVQVTLQGVGIKPEGSNIIIKNNTIITASGSGVYYQSNSKNLQVLDNTISSQSGIGVLIKKVSNSKMPGDIIIVGNNITTSNKYAIDAAEANASTNNIIENNTVPKGKIIRTPEGSYDPTKPVYIFNGTVYNITPQNYGQYIDDNGALSSDIKDGDILNFKGVFVNKKIIFINSAIKITGNNPTFYNTTFRITCDGVWIENLIIKNIKADRVNAWGIHVYRISGATVSHCDIEVDDPNAAYAIYVVESSDVDILNNKLSSSGNYLTYTLLAYAVENSNFINNTIHTLGTGQVHKFESEHDIDNSSCLDGDTSCLDGDTSCLDGDSSCLDGDSSCLDGNTVTDGNHVLAEVYRTYGILMAYSSDNVVSGNKVNASSKLNRTVSPFNSTNSIVGIDSYYNCHNNVFSYNDVYVKSNDNYIYGMGVLGYMTGHTAPEGQGASNNQFIGNNIVLEGTYFVQGIVIGSSSEETTVKNNIINVKSSNVAYGINLEASQSSTITKNTFTLNSDAVYGIETFTSNNNIIDGNNFDANGKQVYGFVFSSSNNNSVTNNKILAKGTGEKIVINLDSIPAGNAGIFLRSASTNNIIKENNITSLKGYAVIVDDEAIDNLISKNYLDSENGIADRAINNTEINIIDNNYKYIFNANLDDVTTTYLGIVTVSMDIESGSFVRFLLGDKEIGNTTSVKGRAIVNYRLDESYTTTGKYTIKAISSKKDYLTSEFTANLKVNKGNLDLVLYDVSGSKNGKGTFRAILTDANNKGVSGISVRFEIYVNGKFTRLDMATTDVNGIAQKEVKLSYPSASYVIRAYISAASAQFNYPVASNEATLSINDDGVKVKFDDISVNRLSDATLTATVTNSANNGVSGLNVNFYKLNELIGSAITDENGVASLIIDNIQYTVGDYVISANVSGNGISPIGKQATLKVSAAQAYVKIFSEVYSNGILAKLMDANGNPLSNRQIMLKIGETEYNVITGADGSIQMPSVAHGKYAINIVFNGDSTYKAKKVVYSVTVMPSIVNNKDYSVYYGNSINYKVRIVGSDGNYVGANNAVTVTVDKVSYKLFTDKNGYVSKSISLNPGAYVVSCEFNGDIVSNRIIFKPILEINNINKNDDDIDISIKVTNPSTGKAWSNKEISFKLNEKIYLALSDKNGIASVSVSNLDVGKYAIFSEYCGCSIRNSIQIK